MASPEDHPAKARHLLEQGHAALGIKLTEMAARCAYLTGFHAATAVILHRTGKAPKTHHGVHSEFARVTRTELDGLGSYMPFLSAAYDLKQTSDYLIGAERPPPDAAQANRALRMATDMLDAVASAIKPPTRY